MGAHIDYAKNCTKVPSMSFVMVSSSVSPIMLSSCSATSLARFGLSDLPQERTNLAS